MQKTQIICSIFLVFFFVVATKSMADSQPSREAKVYIVHTEKPEDQEPEEYHIKTLASVLGRTRYMLFFLLYIENDSILYPTKVGVRSACTPTLFRPHLCDHTGKTWCFANCPKPKTPFTRNRAYVKANSCDPITKPIYLDGSLFRECKLGDATHA